MHVGSVLSPETLILKNFFFNLGIQWFTQTLELAYDIYKQYMLIASAKNLKWYLQFNPDELQ